MRHQQGLGVPVEELLRLEISDRIEPVSESEARAVVEAAPQARSRKQIGSK